jgi:hypothetical protein
MVARTHTWTLAASNLRSLPGILTVAGLEPYYTSAIAENRTGCVLALWRIDRAPPWRTTGLERVCTR